MQQPLLAAHIGNAVTHAGQPAPCPGAPHLRWINMSFYCFNVLVLFQLLFCFLAIYELPLILFLLM
jgi:hypothetical protein